MTTATSVHEPAASLTGARRVRPRGGRGFRPAPRRTPYTFVAPAVLLFVAVFLVPLGYTVYLSTQKTQVSGLGLGAGARKQVAAGILQLQHRVRRRRVLAERAARGDLRLHPDPDHARPGHAVRADPGRASGSASSASAGSRSSCPYAVPTLIGSMIWGMMYLPAFSPINSTLHALFGIQGINFFGQRIVFLSVANIGVWGGTGFNMMVLYTSLRSLPQEAYEAARLDGANERQIALGSSCR